MIYFLILFAVVLRFVVDIPNFAPITAIAIFSGAYLKKTWAVFIPISAMLVSDYFIGFYSWQIMLSVYLSFALSGLLGLWLRRRLDAGNAIGVTLAASIQFYLLTNFAVWAFGTMYPRDFFGLMLSYQNALPFFRNTLLGDLFYVGALFGSYAIIRYMMRKKEQEKIVQQRRL